MYKNKILNVTNTYSLLKLKSIKISLAPSKTCLSERIIKINLENLFLNSNY